MNNKVLLGMSGGVDSGTSAYLLKKAGYEVTGVTFNLNGTEADEKNIKDAKAICDTLGIKHMAVDYTQLFKDKVVTPFIEEYLSGKTPNPCIFCNKNIKFGAFMELADSLGCSYAATGHYAKKVLDEETGKYKLCMADAKNKDQSYVLYNITPYQLEHFLFPLSPYCKDEVRAIAKEAKLPVAQKPDSQDICFVPDGDYEGYILRHLSKEPKAASFVDENGRRLGDAKYLFSYTLGQRKGLGIALGCPHYVTHLDPVKNAVTLTPNESDLFCKEIFIKNVNIVWGEEAPKGEVLAKIRYAHRPCPAVIEKVQDSDLYRIKFNTPQRAPTPGQAAVIYIGDQLIMGGTII